MPPRPSYTEVEARAAVAASLSYAEALRRLGRCSSGGGAAVLKRWCRRWEISTAHFDPWGRQRETARRPRPRPLSEILVAGSTYDRSKLKRRLFEAGLKHRRCEACGQGETWRGRRMSLILGHINGVATDHRLENLRILCPNCNATLDTHCGRNSRTRVERQCELCGAEFLPGYPKQRFCSRACRTRWPRRGRAHPGLRTVARPSFEVLRQEVDQLGFRAVGRKYGVGDNAIRKWLRQYAAESTLALELPQRSTSRQPPPPHRGP